MPEIEFRIGAIKKVVTAEERETILDCALRNAIDAPYSCLEGVCNTCLARVTKDSEPSAEILTCQEIIRSDDPRRVVDYSLD